MNIFCNLLKYEVNNHSQFDYFKLHKFNKFPWDYIRSIDDNGQIHMIIRTLDNLALHSDEWSLYVAKLITVPQPTKNKCLHSQFVCIANE